MHIDDGGIPAVDNRDQLAYAVSCEPFVVCCVSDTTDPANNLALAVLRLSKTLLQTLGRCIARKIGTCGPGTKNN